ncbi:MAG TPA: ATP-binding protein [Opitutaceae bacterium]|nr:ATP-binding protein [Opitutaceae bacterium]
MAHTVRFSGEGIATEILDADDITRRPSRPPDYAAENRALTELADALTEDGKYVWNKIAGVTLRLCRAGSALVALVGGAVEPDRVRWQAVAGAWAHRFRETHVRENSPTQLVLKARGPILLRAPERSFPVFEPMSPAAKEVMLVPIFLGDRAIGSLWAIAHDAEHRFDAEDARVLGTLAHFAAAVFLMSERSGAAEGLRAERLAALNLMEDALAARRETERTTAALLTSEERLREADRRKNHFLAMLGHELRNPLAAIRGGMALLQSKKTSPETRAATLPIVAEQVSHMERLVEDLLDITRIVEGRLQVRKERITVQAALSRAIEMIQSRADAEGFQLNLRMPSEALEVFADAVRLTQIFANLLTNALKYSGGARQIDITAERDGENARVKIRDYGPGIAPELLARIFEPFVQATPSLTMQGGLGLGLTVVRQLVALHGGQVEVFSGGELKGSEFVISLPLIVSAK